MTTETTSIRIIDPETGEFLGYLTEDVECDINLEETTTFKKEKRHAK